ncbi:glycosyltransferase [Colwelliaceae bacterium 6471]
MGQPIISIIIPIYNVEAYLEECLDSVVKQTSNNFTALLINDGSLDGSVKIAEKYVEEHPTIFQLLHKENGGLSDARNFGINKVDTDYVMFVDADDIIAPDTVEVVTSFLKNKSVDVLCFGMTEITEQGRHVRDIPAKVGSIEATTLQDSPELIIDALPNACNKVIKTTLFTNNNIEFPKGLWYEDLATTPKLFHLATSISFIADCLYHYRTREGSITQTISPKLLDMIKVLSSLDSYFAAQHHNHFQPTLLTLKLNMLVKTLVRIAASENEQQQRELLQEVKMYTKENMPSFTGIIGIQGKLIYRFILSLASLNMNKVLLIFLKTCIKKGLVRA